MSESSKIEWTDATQNISRGCKQIDPGCLHCYAKTFAERFRDVPGHPFEQGFDLRMVPRRLLMPFELAGPKKIVNSMSDFFFEPLPDEYLVDASTIHVTANWHTYRILTKRHRRLRDMVNGPLAFAAQHNHISWGVSVSNRRGFEKRVPVLRDANAAVRFLSIEPLIEDLGEIDLSGIHWVIVGGESGYNPRPMEESWVRVERSNI
jgi:protein gp37